MQNHPLVTNLYEIIAAAPLDPAVGIRVARITGSEDFSLFGAEIGPGKKVGAHFHHAGEEIYQIVEGTGLMRLGVPGEDGKVAWHSATEVGPGDCFTVAEGEAHQLFNTGEGRLVAIFGCPLSHLSTDRSMVRGYGEED